MVACPTTSARACREKRLDRASDGLRSRCVYSMKSGALCERGALERRRVSTVARYRLRFLLQEFDLPRGATILGRSSDCHVTIEDPLVSRHHARIVLEGD